MGTLRLWGAGTCMCRNSNPVPRPGSHLLTGTGGAHLAQDPRAGTSRVLQIPGCQPSPLPYLGPTGSSGGLLGGAWIQGGLQSHWLLRVHPPRCPSEALTLHGGDRVFFP